jgi:hypothetical protein
MRTLPTDIKPVPDAILVVSALDVRLLVTVWVSHVRLGCCRRGLYLADYEACTRIGCGARLDGPVRRDPN